MLNKRQLHRAYTHDLSAEKFKKKLISIQFLNHLIMEMKDKLNKDIL